MHAGTIWITGISASGKTTLSRALYEGLRARGVCEPLLIDGEHIRARLGHRYGYCLEDRIAVHEAIVDEAAQARHVGRPVVVATISHMRQMRAHARRRLQPFLEVFLNCPAEVCAARDTKGHYARALRGEYACFIGVTDPYERSKRVGLEIDTAALSVGEASARLIDASLVFFANYAVPRLV